jgi:hypothetical protein
MKTETLMARSLRTGRQVWLWRDRDMRVHATFAIGNRVGACLVGRIIGDEVLLP